MAESKKATVLAYTDKEKEAIAILEANRGEHRLAKDLGIATAILVSLMKKAAKVDAGELSVPEGVEVCRVNKEDMEYEVTVTKTGKAFWID